ncbi:aldo/keto reductase [Halostreptopolyspora alba]|uniref:Aldo/keto reductase n=2 Tax=Halostreptopolyspora alba TaxID=2487137 RepID=A0A3N0EE99_9ACTN|nr:aldo/keto reductase [Nocardiopsaceae bacterium YIM 96095]
MLTRTAAIPGRTLSALGLGCMGMSDFYGATDRGRSVATVRHALDHGITILDTGDLYGMGHNELLLREALRDRRREDVFIAVKFGPQRDPAGRFVGIDCGPAAVKNSLAHTLTRLGTDYVDLYQPARLDPAVPIEETVGAIAEMRQAGHVGHIGLSEVSADTLRRAHAEHAISWLQIEYSLLSRGIEREILPVCRELGVAVSAYGVLSRGLLSGRWSASTTLDSGDLRSRLPRFQQGRLEHNLRLVDGVRRVAEDKGVSVAQLALAWVLSRGEDIIPLVGTRSPERLAESLDAAEISLSERDLARLDAEVPSDAVVGERYDAEQMTLLDSERS